MSGEKSSQWHRRRGRDAPRDEFTSLPDDLDPATGPHQEFGAIEVDLNLLCFFDGLPSEAPIFGVQDSDERPRNQGAARSIEGETFDRQKGR
jgi:hypothetical protein